MGTPFLAEEIEQMFAKITSCQAHSHRISTRLAAILREIADTLNMKAANDSKQLMRLRVLSSYLVHETCRILDNPEVLAIGHDVIPKIRKWIDEHLSEDIPVERLVSFSGYGRSRFYTLFMADTGLSPNDYILRKRIIKAKKLLLSRKPSISMAELSAQCGFNSPSAFAKSFRKIVGKSPREFAPTVN